MTPCERREEILLFVHIRRSGKAERQSCHKCRDTDDYEQVTEKNQLSVHRLKQEHCLYGLQSANGAYRADDHLFHGLSVFLGLSEWDRVFVRAGCAGQVSAHLYCYIS